MNHYDSCTAVASPIATSRPPLNESIGILKRTDEALDLSKAVSYRADRINTLLTGALTDEFAENAKDAKNVRSVFSNLVDTTDVLKNTMVVLDKLICILEE